MLEITRHTPAILPAPFFDLAPGEWEVLRNHTPARVSLHPAPLLLN